MPDKPDGPRTDRRSEDDHAMDQSQNDRQLHVPDRQIETEPDPNRMASRRSPVGESEASTVSRDYQPRTGGPELVASWPLGSTPSQTRPGDEDWVVSESEPVTLQKNHLALPYIGPIEHSILYLNFCGRARTDSEETTLTLELTTNHLEPSGEPYEISIGLSDSGGEYFLSPMVEFAPDTGEYKPGYDIVSGYRLQASVSGGCGYVDQGTAVQLWSE